MCEGGRTTVTPVSSQKTVYGANVIVFEGILAFANKELLKVLLPDAAGHPLQSAAQGQAFTGVLRGWWARSWALEGGVAHCLLAQHLCAGGWGGNAGCCCCEGARAGQAVQGGARGGCRGGVHSS